MIVVRLMGGLGNQLFQYAAAKQLSILNNAELYFDTSFFSTKPIDNIQRKFELDVFNIDYKIATDEMLHHFHGTEFNNTELVLTKLLSFGKFKKYKFSKYGFDEHFLDLKGNYYLRGFFQSEKYFSTIKNIIRDELMIEDKHLPLDTELVNRIKNSENSVSIHIRRGDYIRNLTSMDAHGICSKDYYVKSIKLIREKLGTDDIHFYIFTDDANWVRNEMNWNIDCTLISDKKPIEDFYLMSLCKHNIIANSTFSWWAAWLNKNENKSIILPKQWTNILKTEMIDLVPMNWILK
ncbi:MAG TPA: alpha-1,2-fucosyltransferase [Chitinophagales bacterium]|nr:alpha-1,2-fucosyltransferase [Chitinophagales bacterium]